MDSEFFLKSLAALFAIMSPIANLPIFLSLTGGSTPAERRAVALTAGMTAAAGGAVTLLAGDAVLRLFGIDVDDFRVAGGLLILLIAISMVRGGQSGIHHGSDEEKEHFEGRDSPGVYPLGVPMLIGPGSISTLVVFRAQAGAAKEAIALWAALAVVVALLTATFLGGSWLARRLGRASVTIMGRIMGMILAAIAVEMIATGLKALMPGLAG